jgi:hypothetical protein
VRDGDTDAIDGTPAKPLIVSVFGNAAIAWHGRFIGAPLEKP